MTPAAFNQPIGGWNVSSVTNMGSVFSGAAAFDKPIGDWDVSSATNMAYMFSGAAAFNQPIGGWSVSSVTNVASSAARVQPRSRAGTCPRRRS